MSYRKVCVTLVMVTEGKFSSTEGKALLWGLIARMAGIGWELISLWDTGFYSRCSQAFLF